MTVDALHTLDTNILIYAIDRRAGHKHDIAQSIIVEAARGQGLLTLQVLGEFFHATTRKGYLPASRAAYRVDYWRVIFPVVVADQEALASAMGAIIDHGFSFWDAMLWATAREARCTVIYSEDMQHGRTLGNVEIVNPFL